MEKKPFIGQMDRKIEIYFVEKTKDVLGSVQQTQTLISSPFAAMNEVSGDEDPEGKIRHLVDRTYTVRYNKEVIEKNIQLIIKDADKFYNVTHVKEVGRKSHLILNVKLNE